MIYLSERIEGVRHTRQVTLPEFQKQFDVIVCGLGTAGSLAALFAAENGLSVLGIEAFTCMGGTHTAGGVNGHYFGCPGGRYEQLDAQVSDFAQRYTATAAEGRKLVLEQALHAQGVQTLYEASVCGVYLEDNTVIGLRVITPQGIVDHGARVVMDCTAEAHIATLAGCETTCGREADGQMQPYSLVCMVYNGEKYRYTNIDFGRVDQNDPEALSSAILFAGDRLREGVAGKELIAPMPLLGIREGRRIVPEETVTLEALFAGEKTATPMFYSYADLDKHGWDIAFDGPTLGDWAIGANLGAYNVTVPVPYGAILPKGFEGLLVPCRALGVDRDISSCVRMILDMKKLAEVAAQWASLAISRNKTLRQVPYEQLRQRLEESGCLKKSDDLGYRIDGRKNWDGTPLEKKAVHWITDPEKLPEQLKTETPGQAIWSAKRLGEAALPVLRNALQAPEENLKKHAAFAMAMLGSHEGNAVLREMVIERDGLMLKDCRKHNNLRGCMAIYWLGRLADAQILPELMDLICNPRELSRPVYHQGIMTTRYAIADFNNLYFQFMSQAVVAMIRIGDAHPSLRPRIRAAFTEAFGSGAYYQRITQRSPLSSEGNMVLAMKKVAELAAEKWI